jgi:hypothetical protein
VVNRGVDLLVSFCSGLLVQIAKRLFRVLDCTIDVEGSDIFLVGTAGYILEMCHIAQALEFGLVKHLLHDF